MNAFTSIPRQAQFDESARANATDWSAVVRHLAPDMIRTALVEAARQELLMSESSYRQISFVPCLKEQWERDITHYKSVIAAFEEDHP